MPAVAAAPESAKPQFSGAEVLVAHGTKTDSLLSADQQAKLRRGLDRRDVLLKHQEKLGKGTLQENLRRRGSEHFDVRDNVKAAKDAETNFREAFKKGGSTENETRAKAAIDSSTNYLKYAAIKGALDANGGAYTAALATEYGVTKAQFEDPTNGVRVRALKDLVQNPTVRASFGELLDGVGGPTEQMRLIEETLAKDPALRDIMGRKMEDIRKRAEALPPGKVENEAVKAAEDKRDLATEQITYAHDQIRGYLELVTGAGSFSPTELAAIQADLTRGLQLGTAINIDASLKYLNDTVLNKLASRDPAMQTYILAAAQTNTVAVLERQLAQAKGELGTAARVRNTVLPAGEVARLQGLLDTARQNKTIALDAYNKLPLNVREGTSMKIAQVQEYFSNKKEGDAYSQPFAKELGGIVKNQQEINDANREIAVHARTMSSADKAQRAERAKAEAALLDEMENVASDSIEQIMLERASALADFEITESDERKANDLRAIQDRMKVWSSRDRATRKISRNRAAIGEDIRVLAYYGDEGPQRLMLREIMNGRGGGDLIRNADGNLIEITRDGRKLNATWENIDLNTELPDDLKATLQKAKDEFGTKFNQKLFTDYFAARDFRDRTLTGPFGLETTTGIALKGHEWNALAEAFGDILPQSLQDSNPRTNEALQKLREAGIAPDSKKGKLLLAILLGIMAPAVVGVGAAAALPGAATAGVLATGATLGAGVIPAAAGLGAVSSRMDIA